MSYNRQERCNSGRPRWPASDKNSGKDKANSDLQFEGRSLMVENTRRDFIKRTAWGAGAMLAYPSSARVLGANDRIRVGMIGVGGRGEDLLKQVLEVPNVELVAIADIYSRRREEAKKMAPGIQTLDEHRRLLDMKDIDGVIVASPLHIHARHFLDTLAAGKDLYAEKTMTWSIPEADK